MLTALLATPKDTLEDALFGLGHRLGILQTVTGFKGKPSIYSSGEPAVQCKLYSACCRVQVNLLYTAHMMHIYDDHIYDDQVDYA